MIESKTTRLDLVKKITEAIVENIGDQTRVKDTILSIWEFVQRIEAGGIKIKQLDPENNTSLILERFSTYLTDIVNQICQSPYQSKEENKGRYDGILILVDEVDTSDSTLEIGAFFKYLIESLSRNDCSQITFGLSGLPNMITSMKESHPSSLRMFEELPLGNLSSDDTRSIIKHSLDIAYMENGQLNFEITSKAEDLIVELSGGHPHYIHQLGYCAFNTDNDFIIDDLDVYKGATCSRGAIDILGDIYFKDLFYKKLTIQQQSILLMISNDKEYTKIEDILKKTNASFESIKQDLNHMTDDLNILSKPYKENKYRIFSQLLIIWLQKDINIIRLT